MRKRWCGADRAGAGGVEVHTDRAEAPHTTKSAPHSGGRMASGRGEGVVDRAGPPDAGIVFCDPAGLPFIQRTGPGGAGGASGAVQRLVVGGDDDIFVRGRHGGELPSERVNLFQGIPPDIAVVPVLVPHAIQRGPIHISNIVLLHCQ